MSVLICGLLLDTCGTVSHLLAFLVYSLLSNSEERQIFSPKNLSHNADQKKRKGS